MPKNFEKIITKHFSALAEREGSPLLFAAFCQNGEILSSFSHRSPFLHSGLENPNTPQDVLNLQFSIASITKSFAAAALLQLRDRGIIRLEEPVVTYLPELLHTNFPSKNTIHDLLTMQSGLPTDDPWADRLIGCSNEEFDEILKGPFCIVDAPTVEYHYSNLGYMILGRLISRASGRDALLYIQDNILAPLALKNTSWRRNMSSSVLGYRRDIQLGKEEQKSYRVETRPECQSDSAVFGGLWSSLADLATWIDFFVDAWGNRTPLAPYGNPRGVYESVLSQSSRREMQTPTVSVPPRDSITPLPERVHYGLGLRQFNDSQAIGHSGGLPGFGSHIRWAPKENLGIIAVANVTYCPVWDACREALHEAREQEFRSTPVSETSRSLATQAPLNSIVGLRGQQLISLLKRTEPLQEINEHGAALFASNFFLDFPFEDFEKQRLSLLPKFSECSTFSVNAERGLGAKILCDGKDILFFSLAPVESGKIQYLKFCLL